MTYATITRDLHEHVCTLTLSRPARLNAFTVEMANELVDAFDAARDDDAVRAIIVTGAGRAFCAGMDLRENGNVFGLNEALRPTMRDLEERLTDPEIVSGVRDTGGRVTLAIFACDKPVIGAINGAAIGIGATMTLAMDIRLASDNAKFGFVFGKLGIVPEACSTWFLPRIVGLPTALRWTYSAEIFDAATAHVAGLVQPVLSPDALMDEARRLAATFANERSPASTALIRRMMYRNSALAHPLEAHRAESLAMLHTSQRDGREGVAAVRERRLPVFVETASSVRRLLDDDG